MDSKFYHIEKNLITTALNEYRCKLYRKCLLEEDMEKRLEILCLIEKIDNIKDWL